MILLNDELWPKLKTTLLLQQLIYDKRNLRMVVEGMPYRMQAGCPWRDVPEFFGDWNLIYKRFNAWSAKGKWRWIFKALVADADLEWVSIDGN